MSQLPFLKMKSIRSILEDNPSLCSQLSRCFPRSSQSASHSELFQMTHPLLGLLAHGLSPIPTPVSKSCPKPHPLLKQFSLPQPTKFTPGILVPTFHCLQNKVLIGHDSGFSKFNKHCPFPAPLPGDSTTDPAKTEGTVSLLFKWLLGFVPWSVHSYCLFLYSFSNY